ncbi:hypothetical protein EQG41_18890 [Billgrantia azerbaijanica]|nr:hypothetical protein EQG41_18890 [Halomonas azerbaijanica]
MIKNFGDTAERLSGSPLGIIALFIVLLYGIAGFVLSSSADFLTPEERTPLIWFLVIFPFLVLGVFAWLVSQHHTKLYAPKDFVSDETFLRALTPVEKEEKQREEIEKYGVSETSASVPSELTFSSPSFSRKPLESRSGVFREYALAERLAIKKIREDRKIQILEDQELRRGNQRVQVDGLSVSENLLTAFEIQYFKGDSFKKNLRNRMSEIAYKAMRLAAFSKNSEVKLVYVAVVDGLSDEGKGRIEELFSEFTSASIVPIEIEILDFDVLKAQFEEGSYA